MNRRSFFRAAIAAVAVAAADPEKLLWEPGRKLISIPKRTPDLQALMKYCGSLAAMDYGVAHSEAFVSFFFRGDLFLMGERTTEVCISRPGPIEFPFPPCGLILTQELTREECAARYPA